VRPSETPAGGRQLESLRRVAGGELLGVVAVLPYMMELVGSGIFGQAPAPGIPMPLVFTLALLQNGILLAVTIPW
jgi:hypothetical protein